MAEKTTVDPPSNIDEILGYHPTKIEFQNSIQHLNNKKLLIKTDTGWVPSDFAKSHFNEELQGSCSKESLLGLASKIKNI